MSKVFVLNMTTDNDAFECNRQHEVARILREIADKVEQEGFSGFYETIHDYFGNDVGRYALKNKD